MEALLGLVVIVLFSLLGMHAADFFASLKPAVTYMLALVMLCMGLTLKIEDFLRVFKKPLIIGYAGFLQFSLMPLLGYSIARLMELNDELLFGVVLVGSAPGGTASNVITYLSKGDVAYSVSMTTFSTLISPLLTPLLTYLFIGKGVEVSFIEMTKDLMLITLTPVVGGLVLRRFMPGLALLERFLPYLAIFFIGIIIAVVLAINKGKLEKVGIDAVITVMLHNILGLAIGYIVGVLAGFERTMAKTLSIEVGVQNSGLAAVLALKHFSPLSALPGALFSLFQNVNGLLISMLYRKL
ncbi:MAG: bile acid:sodium symporter family protein [Aquificaceae bacterium]|nr:bile acid:sodium symporter family protein [Aquificaceae bacterium]